MAIEAGGGDVHGSVCTLKLGFFVCLFPEALTPEKPKKTPKQNISNTVGESSPDGHFWSHVSGGVESSDMCIKTTLLRERDRTFWQEGRFYF